LGGLNVIPVNKTTAAVSVGLNLGLRLLTNQPITSLLPGTGQQ
jgi:hypothetical protein